jgi:hypothetical protein
VLRYFAGHWRLPIQAAHHNPLTRFKEDWIDIGMVRNELGVRMKKESYVYVWQVIIYGSSKVKTRNKRIKKTK